LAMITRLLVRLSGIILAALGGLLRCRPPSPAGAWRCPAPAPSGVAVCPGLPKPIVRRRFDLRRRTSGR
jgi:hypothetical protein